MKFQSEIVLLHCVNIIGAIHPNTIRKIEIMANMYDIIFMVFTDIL